VMSGGVCTSPSDCCAGLTCNIAVGGLQGTCGVAPPPPRVDGGPPPSPDAPACSTTGQSCTSDAQCCYGTCQSPSGTACTPGQMGCTCYYVVP
jgi:hypothetical protein